MRQQFHLINESIRQNAIRFVRELPLDEKHPLVVEILSPKRTSAQNKKMWPLLRDLSRQVVWYGCKYSEEDWKDLITALLKKVNNQEQRMAPGIDGGIVMFGQRTSKMKIPEMVEVIETIYWFGVLQDVKFSEESQWQIEWARRWGEMHEQTPSS